MYLEIKALHLISMVTWFAGLFYIFRLFVYHRENCGNPEICALFSVMERRLLSLIILPASLATACFGFTLAYLNPQVLSASWLWAKLGLVILLFCYQALAYRTYQSFGRAQFFLSARACRIINEAPTIVLIGVVFLAVLKPRL